MIKQIPEDFTVIEHPLIKFSEAKEENDYSYYLLKKKDCTTMDALKIFAEKANINVNKLGFAGTKDKKAMTEQYFSALNCRIKELKTGKIEIKLVGYGKKPISLGDLKGNEFIINVRNLDNAPKIPDKLSFLNLFDEQRFSSNNAEIGNSLIKKDFKKAVKLILGNMKGNSSYEKDAENHLKRNPTDFIGALKRIPRKILTLFINSYQSEIWNNAALKLKHDKKYRNAKLPLVGFGTEFEDKHIESIIIGMLKKDEICLRDFIIRELKELSSEGSERALFVKDVKIGHKIEDDNLNKGKKKAVLKFFLPKGSYATRVIKEIFGETAYS